MCLNSFLSGQKSTNGTVAERLDLNRNYIIDACDYELLKNIILGYDSTYEVNSVNTNNLPSDISINYNIYDPVSGARTNTYRLYSNPSISFNTSSTYGIIGYDSRAQQDGMQGVLSVKKANGSNFGTAFLVDSHTILTAAHVLYDFETHTVNNGLQFKVYDDYDTVTDVVITPNSYHIPYNFCNSSDSNLDGEYNYSDVKK